MTSDVIEIYYARCHKSFCFYHNSAQSGDDVTRCHEAIDMLLELKRRADDTALLKRIDAYAGDVTTLGPLIRHVRI